jgi:hypothetical protein
MKNCSINNCNKKNESKGYCRSHYNKFRRHGDPLYKRKLNVFKKCKIENCNNKIHSLGYCHSHYNKFKRHGNPNYKQDLNYLKKCSVDNCKNNQKSMGYCNLHYLKLLKYKNPTYKKTKINSLKCEVDKCNEYQHGKGYCMEHYLKLIRYNNPTFEVLCFTCKRQTQTRGLSNRNDRKNPREHWAPRFFKDKLFCTSCYKRLLQEIIFFKLNPICNCCGETNRFFLQIDHIHNDGYLDKKDKSITSAIVYYEKVIKNIQNFQILCANCNFGKLVNEGVCPHKKIMRFPGRHKKSKDKTSSFTEIEINSIRNFANENYQFL